MAAKTSFQKPKISGLNNFEKRQGSKAVKMIYLFNCPKWLTWFLDPIGATIEIQRKMRMDEAEERFTRQQMEQIRIREQHIQRQIRRQQPARQATPTPPCKKMINQLELTLKYF